MSEMIERVARAISNGTYDDCNTEPDQRRAYRDLAKSAIEAMREPTAAMLNSNAKTGYTWSCIVDCEGMSAAYSQIIDGALADE